MDLFSPTSRLVRCLRRPGVPLFALVFGCYGYFYQAGGWNQNSRFDLTRAIVERGTLAIDAFQQNTGDKARRQGHWFSDKAPGLSWLSVPPYAAVHAVRPGDLAAGSYAATLLAVALPSALAALLLFGCGRAVGLSSAWSAGVTVSYALGTLAWPYSTMLYGHQLAAALGFSAFVLVWKRRWPALGGFLLGLAVCVDYTAAVLVVIVVAYAVFVLGWRRAAGVVLGGVPAAAALAAYHAVAFGAPLALPYDFVMQAHRREGWFMGIAAPDPAIVRQLLVGEYRGLFYSMPWLAAGLPGAFFLYRAGHRAEAVACTAVFLAFLALNAGLVDWHGAWAIGPRYLVPSLPFLALAATGLVLARPPFSAARRWLAAAGTLAAAASLAMMLIGTSVKPEVPLNVQRPFPEFLFPRFFHGHLARNQQSIDSEYGTGTRQAWNLGHLLGLEGLLTLAPLGLWMAVTGLWLSRATHASGSPSRAVPKPQPLSSTAPDK